MSHTVKHILDREQARKDNQPASGPKRQRPKSKTGMQVLMGLISEQS